ncbi:ribonuclease J [Candidatus Sumerlaeota bacterium]
MNKTRRNTGKGQLRIMPLGGCNEIGLNMTVLECEGQILIVDCGQMFPEEDMPGVDLVICDTTYLEKRLSQVQGIVLTHGHEDHLGALPYILPRLNVPVYGTTLTLGILGPKLAEYKLDETTDVRDVPQREPRQIGAFSVEWVNVTHSIPNASALIIRTPAGIVVFSGDYKIDYSPVDGREFDFHALASVGEEGVLALLADSTNVHRPGPTPREASVIPALEKYFQECEGSLVLATFASSLHRVQVCLNLAAKYGRKVYLSGLNMERNVRIAAELGFLDVPDDLLRPLKQYPRARPQKRMVLTTGSQGEPLSGLSRMALDSHKQVKVQPEDTVILSARVIPGNERAIYRMVNHFFRRGARVIYEELAPVHASGHAYSDDMRQLLSLVRPRFLIPVHGEMRHQLAHKDLAAGVGMKPEDVFVLGNGKALELRAGSRGLEHAQGRILDEAIPASRVLVDGSGIGDIHEVVLRDRLHLGEDGVILVLLTIDRETAELLAGPEIVSRGFVYMDENEALINEIRQVVLDTFNETEKESREEWAVVKEAVRRAVRRFVKKRCQKFPIILPVVTEI